jgi:hypothetical protein
MTRRATVASMFASALAGVWPRRANSQARPAPATGPATAASPQRQTLLTADLSIEGDWRGVPRVRLAQEVLPLG